MSTIFTLAILLSSLLALALMFRAWQTSGVKRGYRKFLVCAIAMLIIPIAGSIMSLLGFFLDQGAYIYYLETALLFYSLITVILGSVLPNGNNGNGNNGNGNNG